MPRNFKVMMVRSGIANFVINVNPYNSLYVLALGASATQLVFLTSIGMEIGRAHV